MVNRHDGLMMAVCCVLATAGLQSVVYAESWEPDASVQLFIGERQSVVLRSYQAHLFSGRQEALLQDIPPEADVAALMIREKRIPLRVLEWARVKPDGYAQFSFHPDGRLRWQKNSTESRVEIAGELPVRCIIESVLSGTRSMDVMYPVSGLSWQAFYYARVRGDLRKTATEFSVDLQGCVRLHNDTGMYMPNATITLAGYDDDPDEGTLRLNRLGFLALSDSPLADLWRDLPAELKRLSYVYALPQRYNLQPYAWTYAPFLDAHRVPAKQYYVMRSDEVPLEAKGAGIALDEVISFENTGRGLGMPLPAGAVIVARAGALRQQVQAAHMQHAPVGREIHVNLGPDQAVSAYRERVGRSEDQGGSYREFYRILIQNRHEQSIRARLQEHPPSILKWVLINSDVSAERKDAVLLFEIEVPGSSTREVHYSIRVERPTL